MNIRIFTFFILMVPMVGISNAEKISTTAKVLPSPVVFVSRSILYSDELFEYVEWKKQCEKANILSPSGDSAEQKALSAKISEIHTKKIPTVSASIAKRLGACAVLKYESYHSTSFYINPLYDITQEVIDTLNQEYIESQPKKPTFIKLPQNLLREAIICDSVEDIKQAIEAGANVHQKIDGKTPLGLAVLYKRSKAVKSLLEYGATADETLFEESLKQNEIKSAIFLAINCGINLDAIYCNGIKKDTLVGFSGNKYDLESVFLLMKKGASISGDTIIIYNPGRKETLAKIALGCGQFHPHKTAALELLQEFIKGGYNVNNIWRESDGKCANVYSSEKNEILELFIKNGANPNQIIHESSPLGCTWTPLFKAIEVGCEDTVKILLNAGADVNQKANPFPGSPPLCPNGPQTPLSFAINKGKIAIAELLRKHGASL